MCSSDLPKTGYFLKLTLANRLHGIAFCIFIIPLRNFFVNDLKIFVGYRHKIRLLFRGKLVGVGIIQPFMNPALSGYRWLPMT